MTEYLVANFTPYGSWGAAAYSQHENLTLLQIASITGLYGVSFLIAWFAAVCNWAWERNFEWREMRPGVAWLASIVVAMCFFGGARLGLAPPDNPTVRVASLSKPDIELIPDPDLAQRVFSGAATADDFDEIQRRGHSINEDLMRRSDREARAGAEMDHFVTADRVMISQVPTRGVNTVYSKIGDLFSWLCIMTLLRLIVVALRQPS